MCNHLDMVCCCVFRGLIKLASKLRSRDAALAANKLKM